MELTSVCGQFAISNRFQDTMRLPIEEQGEIDKIKLSVRADPLRIKSYIENLLKDWPRTFPVAREMMQTRAADAAATPAVPSAAGRSRLPLLNAATAAGESVRYLTAAEELLGGPSNAVRTWAHDPYQSKLFLPLQTVLEREGAGSILPTALKLMVSIRIGHLNKATYSLAHRTAMARVAGLPGAQIAALADAGWAASGQFTALEAAAVTWAERVTDNTAKRRNDLFDGLKHYFSEAEIVELTGLCAFSNRMDLLYNALRIPLESEGEIAALNRTARLAPHRLKAYIETLLTNWPTEFPEPAVDG
jgi:alkylhydroperoxidase family enzyme